MARYGVPIVLACLYVLGSTWFVSNEGRAYRESLRRSRPAASEAPVPPAEQDRGPEVAEQTDAISEPPPPPREAPPPNSKSVSETPPPPRVAEETKPSPTVASAGPSPAASTPGSAPPPAAVPSPNDQAARIERWKKDEFWSQPALAKQWDLDHFTIGEEQQLGEQLNALILQLNAEDRETDKQRIKVAAQPFLERLPSKEREYRFFVLNSVVPNAFSHPGGYIYLSRKLLEMIPEDENYLLEFIVGHEIAHVELQHALKCLRDPGVRSFNDGTMQKMYFLVLQYGYPDQLEYDADAWVYRRMKSLRRSEHDCLGFLRKLDAYAKTHGFPNGRGKPEDLLKEQPRNPEGGPMISPIDNHLRSHPAAYDRLNRLKGLSAQVSHSPK
jgi:Peptidase family M48